MPRRPSIDEWPVGKRSERPHLPKEHLSDLVRLFARRAAENYFEDLIRAQNDGKLKSQPEPD